MYARGGEALMRAIFGFLGSFAGGSSQIVVLVVLCVCPVLAQDASLDAFLCHEIRVDGRNGGARFPHVQGLSLTDDIESGDFDVVRPQVLCNPAKYNGALVIDEDTHLTGYRILGSEGNPRHVRQRDILLDNRLGTSTVNTWGARRLLMPSAADLANDPGAIDPAAHTVDAFKCYRIKPSNGAPRLPRGLQVDLEDAFGAAGRFTLSRNPVQLCYPVDIENQGKTNPAARLLCFRGEQSRGEARISRLANIHVNNDFGSWVFKTQREFEICIPSGKELPLGLTVDEELIVVGRTVDAYVMLGEPAPPGGRTVSLESLDPGIATIAPPSVNIPEGQLSATVSVTGVVPGTTTLRATATGLPDATEQVTVTDKFISLGNIPEIAPGENASLPISLSQPAPAGGVSLTLESDAPGIATVDATVVIPAGAQVPATNPQVTGVNIGTARIIARGQGIAADSRDVVVTLDLSFSPTSLSVGETQTRNIRVELSGPAPVGGVAIDLTLDDPSIATAPATVTVLSGELSVDVPVTGALLGSTTLRASLVGGTKTAAATVTVTQLPDLRFTAAPSNVSDLSSVAVGEKLQRAIGMQLAVAPLAPVNITVTVTGTSVAISDDPNTLGGNSVTFTNVTNTGLRAIYVQGLTAGATVETLTAQAAGYNDDTATATVNPAGFVFSTGSVSTTSFSTDTSVSLRAAVLDPTTFAPGATQEVRAGVGPVDVQMNSTVPSVGTITTPITFNPGSSSASGSFDPLAGGSTQLQIVTPPAGFSLPSSGQQITATVTAPDLLLTTSPSSGAQLTSVTVGDDLQTAIGVYLTVTPPSPVDITVTVTGSGVAISADPNTLGGSSVTFTNVANAGLKALYVQGLTAGATVETLTAQAAGYNDDTAPVTVNPAGFVFSVGSFSTTTFSTNTSVALRAVVLDPTTLAPGATQQLRAGVDPVDVQMNSTVPSVGTITNPITFNPGSSTASGSFDPLAAGITQLQIVTPPAGFSLPSSGQQITATVTAPDLLLTTSPSSGAQLTSVTVGDDLQTAIGVYLTVTPPSPVDITVTVTGSGVAISADPNTLGGSSVTFTNVANAGLKALYVQGLTAGATVETLTAQAAGYNDDTAPVTVNPAGFVFSVGSFSTTTFSTNTSVALRAVVLDPTTLAPGATQQLRAGVDPVDVQMNSTVPSVGTITNPITFNPGSSTASGSFDPLAAGITQLQIVTPPAGFSLPSSGQQITATVTAPDLLLTTSPSSGAQLTSVTVGDDLQTAIGVYLTATPPSPVDITVTVTGSSVAISADPNTLGGSSVTFANVASAGLRALYVQGLNGGTVQLAAQAAGYNDDTAVATVNPSGFVFSTGDFTASSPVNVSIRAVVLNPATLAVSATQALRAGLGPVSVDVESSDPAVGTITSPYTFNPGDSTVTEVFTPLSTGQTLLSIPLQPSGFDPPSGETVRVATVP